MKSKGAFVGRFLALFALLATIGWWTSAPQRYATALGSAAAVASPVVNGWWLEARTSTQGQEQLWYRRGNEELRMLLSLPALALGLLPLLSLIGATPRLGWKRLTVAALAGSAGLFGLDLLILLVYPLLVNDPNAFTDIAGTFLGLLTFVGGPVILWFLLTYDRLKGVWKLTP
jgi:hypothetical protein